MQKNYKYRKTRYKGANKSNAVKLIVYFFLQAFADFEKNVSYGISTRTCEKCGVFLLLLFAKMI